MNIRLIGHVTHLADENRIYFSRQTRREGTALVTQASIAG